MIRAIKRMRTGGSTSFFFSHNKHLFAAPAKTFTPAKSNFAPFSSSPDWSPPPSSSDANLRKYIGYSLLVMGCATATYFSFPFPENTMHKKASFFRYAPLPDQLHTISNWSATHEARARVFFQPESVDQLEKIVREANEKRQKIRPVGSGLSPNGIGLSRAGMLNLALMDKVLDVDKENKTVRVQAGIRVQQLVDLIKEFGLTLQNFASIREQQIGGIVQVGAHGTGARLPPIDEQVISMKLVTPGRGTLEISKEKDPDLFYLARCGLGGLGVVAEVTIQCVERQELVEHTFVTNMEGIRKNHVRWLNENKHLKYLHIPYTDTIVVVQCNNVSKWRGTPKFRPKYSKDEALRPIRDLYRQSLKTYRNTPPDEIEVDINELSLPELRERLVAFNPLNQHHIVEINQAEAEFWKRSEGYRRGWSDELLAFDCGGQQWVSEICLPAGTLSKPSMKDIEYIEELKQMIEKHRIPAPAPIEQRWSAQSRSLMSPASSEADDSVFSWVGIIMYLPTEDPRQRKEITEKFVYYQRLCQLKLWDKYSAYEHWAKIEVPKDINEITELQERIRRRFPVNAYNSARNELDPNSILSNRVLQKLFPFAEKPV